MHNKNIVILAGNDLRHQIFIQHLKARFHIAEIYIEKSHYPSPEPRSIEKENAWNSFFQQRDLYEKEKLLKSKQLVPKNEPRITYLGESELNTPLTITKIANSSPGFIAVFGTSLLKEPFLKAFPNQLFNLHVGDPEYYRGSSCNYWPIYKGNLQHLSATIHKIDPGIDSGDILRKQSITISNDDSEQSLMFKPLALGTQLMIETIENWIKDSLKFIPQNRSGKLYRKVDFTPKVVLEFKQMVESGRLKTHIKEAMKKPAEVVGE